jgi:hypothetical protein
VSFVFLIFLVLMVLAVAFELFGRFDGTVGGIAQHSMEGRRHNPEQGRSEVHDHEAFVRLTDRRGTR